MKRNRLAIVGIMIIGAVAGIGALRAHKNVDAAQSVAKASEPVTPHEEERASVPSMEAPMGEAKTVAPPSAAVAQNQDIDIKSFILENDLPDDAWSKYHGKSLTQLTEIKSKMEERFLSIKASTDGQSAKRSQLLDEGRTDEADRVLADELLPAFEERRRIAAEAVLLARAMMDRRRVEAEGGHHGATKT